MYAVIFKAKINQLDDEYSATAERMRDLAEQYGCTEFVSAMEGDREIAISYWQDLEQIKQWKQNAEHLAAQQMGREQWYACYQVEVVEILRQYQSN